MRQTERRQPAPAYMVIYYAQEDKIKIFPNIDPETFRVFDHLTWSKTATADTIDGRGGYAEKLRGADRAWIRLYRPDPESELTTAHSFRGTPQPLTDHTPPRPPADVIPATEAPRSHGNGPERENPYKSTLPARRGPESPQEARKRYEEHRQRIERRIQK